MINIKTERLIPLREVPQLGILPPRRSGSRLNVSTIYRWALHGQRGIKLESLKIGGQRVTSLNALQTFCSALAGNEEVTPNPITKQSASLKRSKEVEAKLDQLGIKAN